MNKSNQLGGMYMEFTRLLVEANKHLTNSNYEQAVGVLQEALKLELSDDNKNVVYDQLAICFMQLGRYTDALFFLEELAGKDSYEFIDEVYGNMLVAYEKLSYFHKALELVRDHKDKIFNIADQNDYAIEHYYHMLWWNMKELGGNGFEWQKNHKFTLNPKISIIVPAYNSEPIFLRKMFESVCNQIYDNWELCVADGNSENPEIKKIISDFADSEKRIKYIFLDENRGISENSNAAIEISTGEYLAFLDDDDLLAPNALYEIVSLINEKPDAGLIYSDMELITGDGVPAEAFLSPAWSPVLLEQCNYVIHFVVAGRDLAYKAGLLNKKFDIAQDLDFLLKISEHTDKIYSIPKILYYWRIYKKADNRVMSFEEPEKDIDSQTMDSVVQSRIEHMNRMNIQYENRVVTVKNRWITPLRIIGKPLISVILCGSNGCADFCLKKASDENVEILFADTGNDYAEAYNLCAKEARGEYILFMSNCCGFLTDDWLREYLRAAHYPQTGVIGGKVNYLDEQGNVFIPSGRVFVGSNAGVDDFYKSKKKIVQLSLNEDLYYYFNTSGLAPACFMVSRDLFEKAGGFDPSLPLTFFCLDLCLRVRDMGYFNIYITAVEMNYRQYEEVFYRDARNTFENELAVFKSKWKSALEKNDPYLNPSLSIDMFERYNCIFNFDEKILHQKGVI